MPPNAPRVEEAANIRPMIVNERGGGGSTDVADVSWAVATGGCEQQPGSRYIFSFLAGSGGRWYIYWKQGNDCRCQDFSYDSVDLITNGALVENAKNEHQNRLPSVWGL
ncbi:MAG: hypothetical protein CM1200mP40_17340 [Gammaproteobacteria bacterium]|nr:MAG: hypothetical protein CM1200mP40_17340 [Gammaproteobacteria bacterium]